MLKIRPRFSLLVLSFLFYCMVFVDQAFPENFKLSGYYKNLFYRSTTSSTKQDYYADLNRLRLELNAPIVSKVTLKFIYDNNIIMNDFSQSADFETLRRRNQKNINLVDMDKTVSDRHHLFWTTGVYRAYVKYTDKKVQATLGKQYIDWSRMKFYRPLDLFNPVSPLDLEKDEKIGVDALNVNYFPSCFGSLGFIYAPLRNGSRSSYGVKAASKISSYDVALTAAKVQRDVVYGASFDGYVGEAGLRGEVAFLRKYAGPDAPRLAVGMDHNFTPKLYGLMEYFYNGVCASDKNAFTSSFEYSRTYMSMKRHIIGSGLEYQLTGITKLAAYIFYDPLGDSFFYNPEVKCNVNNNLELQVGLQLFSGPSDNNEFGSYHNLAYFQLKQYF